MQDIQILFFDKKEKKFRLDTTEKIEFIKDFILSNVAFFVLPYTQEIIRKERKPIMSSLDAKFPHAFAVATIREPDMRLAEDPSLKWQDFDYDVFKDDFFCLDENKESLKGRKIKHLMIKQSEEKMERKVVLE